MLRKTPVPLHDQRLTVSPHMLLDPLDFQRQAVAQPSTRPARVRAPDLSSSASVSVVLPLPLCPTRATLRILGVVAVPMRCSFVGGGPWGQASQDDGAVLGTFDAGV